MTHVLFNSAVVKGGYNVQKDALIQVWPLLLFAPLLPLGTEITLSTKLKKVPLKASLTIEGKSFDSWCSSKGIVFEQAKCHRVEDD